MMKFKVRLLRRAGRRLAWREVQDAPAAVGVLVSHMLEVRGERYALLTLRPEDPVAPPPLPDLYEPVLLGFSPLAFRLRGFERAHGAGGPCAVVQEWYCELP